MHTYIHACMHAYKHAYIHRLTLTGDSTSSATDIPASALDSRILQWAGRSPMVGSVKGVVKGRRVMGIA